MNGVYTNAPGAGTVVNIKRPGNSTAWITYKAYPGHFPKIQHNTWHGIAFSNGASYIQVQGLEVVGNNANITLAYALSQKTNGSNPLTNGSCISIGGSNAYVHHIRILNNKVHGCGGGGIGGAQADYVTIDNNIVFDNAWYSVYGCSGIGFLSSWNSDNNRGYKMFITNNKVYRNRMYIPWIAVGKITDGNGIIIDSSKKGPNGAYQGRTLIANNISYWNGGSGIHAHDSEHVDIVNNTVYGNGQTPELKKGQLYAGYSSDVKIFNNIIYAYSGQNANSNTKNVNVTYDYNLYPKGAVIAAMGPHDIIGDPLFVNTSIPDFRIKPGSPAINSGYYWKDLKTDYLGKTRPAGGRYDIGAYEYQ
ncbi:choice-of-anchor Q domain-containing protein [Nostoc sp. KVJ3]|uniref:choice-of-anchor Q domain-containing protein n=1 Tax=Nostoc sp. KVJ3 TaxID=457945 RepID=UPI0022381DA1|nr:choice-of-anchor Q domain-containing protein [Nostoc sp. KVJ3]